MFEIDESSPRSSRWQRSTPRRTTTSIGRDQTALATYIEAFGYKVDRIANYLKAQKAEADLAQREAERLQARHRARRT